MPSYVRWKALDAHNVSACPVFEQQQCNSLVAALGCKMEGGLAILGGPVHVDDMASCSGQEHARG
jgi:hypothetical protein